MRSRRPHPLLFVLLSSSLLCAACVPTGRSSGSGGGGGGGGGGEVNNGEQPEETLDLGRCQSGGGSLSSSQCNTFWDCNNTGFFDEEVPLFEVSCNGEPETCRCSVDDEELAVFTAENPGDFCGIFSEPAFAERIMERCQFPDGPGEVVNANPNNVTPEPDPPKEGLEAFPTIGCVDASYDLSARYFGAVADANLLLMWTDPPPEVSPGIEGYAWGELHPITLADTSTETQPSTSLSLSLQVNDVYRPGTRSLPGCEGWQSQATLVLRLEDAQQRPLTCLIWGHDTAGLLAGDYSTNDIGLLDEDVAAQLADCVFEEF